MSIASIIGTTAIIGVVSWIIFFFFWTYGGNKLFWKFWHRKKVIRARKFIIYLDKKYPDPNTKEREERERELIKSGFNKNIIEKAQEQLQKPYYKIYHWLDSAFEQGSTEEQCRQALIERGFEEKVINYAIKKLNKERLKYGTAKKESTTSQGLPTGNGTDVNTEGTNSTGVGNRDVATERERVLQDSETPTDEGKERPVKRDWPSFS
jgi:SOS response regulatory protein OraA/RecX|tara:strand:- start:334 stop:957 length:624 start_codon:yes stop_codon:yes gene_type:complete